MCDPSSRVAAEMRVYCGDTRSRKLVGEFRRRGIGAVAVRGKLHLRVLSPWFFDNGAFEDWTAQRPFDGEAFRRDLATIGVDDPPDFVVAPDLVAGGVGSLELSVAWLPELRRRPWPIYLAVQDGLECVALPLESFDGIFIGGTVAWKCATAPYWAAEGRRLGMPVHFARCGNAKRVGLARALGCASIDSSLPLWSKKKLAAFVNALDQQHLLSEFACEILENPAFGQRGK